MTSAVVSRYLVREFLGYFLPILFGFVVLYLVVDFFDRLDILLRHNATASAAARYFVFKIPLMITQVTPPAVLAAILISLGSLARRNEIIALRSVGISLLQTAIPLILVGAAISAASLAWDETVVPYCSRKFQYVNVVEIRQRPQRGLLSDKEVWYHGRDGFYNIDYVDPGRNTVHGLTIYRMTSSFALDSVIEVPTASWDGQSWHSGRATERVFSPTGDVTTRVIPPNEVKIAETLEDFLEVHHEAEELSFTSLRERIAAMASKGIDTSTYMVDLHLKLAVPCASVILTIIGVPLAGRARRHASVAGVIGVGLTIGFGYWVVLALATSLGHSGALPAPLAAWAANGVFGLVGIALFLGRD